ncbi:MAG TPA: hypothetical protein VMB79_18295 [Jatrophihabitans sp.]|nr:hypothetical protein [Jatrophihabitans sp.]
MSGVSTYSGASRAGGPGSDQRMQAALSAASQLFGMSTGQLQSSLASGQSMSAIAASKGISAQDLTSTLESAISSTAPQGSAPSQSMLDRIAGNIAHHTGAVGSAGHHRHTPAASATAAAGSGATTGRASGAGSVDTFA